MADNSTGTTVLTTSPFFSLLAQVQDVKTKVADSVFENYKLQVAQSNDINNRAMQTALAGSSSYADLKAAVSKSVLEAMLSAANDASSIGRAAAQTQTVIMEKSQIDRNLINGLNTQNLNTALININTAIDGLNGQYSALGLSYGGAVGAYQSLSTNSAINSLNSVVSGQRVINTGVMTGTNQTSTSTSIG